MRLGKKSEANKIKIDKYCDVCLNAKPDFLRIFFIFGVCEKDRLSIWKYSESNDLNALQNDEPEMSIKKKFYAIFV